MIRRSLILIGIVALLQIQQAGASSYVQRVRERANAGIEDADQSPTTPTTEESLRRRYQLDWVYVVTHTFFQMINPASRARRDVGFLKRATPCLQADIALIDGLTEKARARLLDAVKERKTYAILKLLDVILFLQRSQNHLIAGALDPSYEDPDWYRYTTFERPRVWCCVTGQNACEHVRFWQCTGDHYDTAAACQQAGVCRAAPNNVPDESPVCPASSDYARPDVHGFGCGVGALEDVLATLTEEDKALHTTLTTDTEALRSLLVSIQQEVLLSQQANQVITVATGVPALPAVPTSLPVRQIKEGCLPKHCEDAPDVTCTTDDDCEEEDGGTCVSVAADVGVQEGIQTPFSLEKNHVGLLQRFGLLLRSTGNDAPLPESMTDVRGKGTILELFQQGTVEQFRSTQQDRAAADAPLFAMGVDPRLAMKEALAPFATSLDAFPLIIRDLRTAVRSLAVTLRASCLQSPCRLTLERAISITTHDECFAAGTYQECAAAVDRDLAGRK